MNCPRVGKMFGCKFEPRYSSKTIAPTAEQIDCLSPPVLAHELTALRTVEEIYEGDVCVRCGRRAETPRD